jgi:cytoskeletal protein CcmA (bactofilin family)
VDAAEIVVRGQVTGALFGRDRVEIGSTGEVRGDISTPRISIGEGAQMHGKVEIERTDNSRGNARNIARNTSQINSQNTRAQGGVSEIPPAMKHAAAMKAGADNGD